MKETLSGMIADSMGSITSSSAVFPDQTDPSVGPDGERPTNAADVRSLYRLLLGREPESDWVIESNEGRRLSEIVGELLGSDEFRVEREKLIVGGVVGGDRFHGSPDDELRGWVAEALPLTAEGRREASGAGAWRELFACVLSDPEFVSLVPERLKPELIGLAAALHVRRTDLLTADAVDARDVRGFYKLLLGREPESSAAIEANEGRLPGEIVEALLGSDEFRIEREKLVLGGVVGGDHFNGSPDEELKQWIVECLPLTAEGRRLIGAANTWRDILLVLLTDAGFAAAICGTRMWTTPWSRPSGAIIP
jgi:hypothetical protein